MAFLRKYNKWRRGSETIEQPRPEDIGYAIDAACEIITKLTKTTKEKQQ